MTAAFCGLDGEMAGVLAAARPAFGVFDSRVVSHYKCRDDERGYCSRRTACRPLPQRAPSGGRAALPSSSRAALQAGIWTVLKALFCLSLLIAASLPEVSIHETTCKEVDRKSPLLRRQSTKEQRK